MGVLTQIDNMTAGLISPPAAQPAQEPDELTIAYMSGLYDGKKAEREACAKVCDEHNARQNLFAEERYAAHWLASAIRARGNT